MKKYIFYICVSLFMLYISTPILLQNIAFVSNAKQATGTIQRIDYLTGNKYSRSKAVHITFTDFNGAVINFTDNTLGFVWTPSDSLSVPVLYDVNNPQDAIFAGGEDYWLFYWGTPIALFVMSILLLVDNVRKIIKLKR